MGKNIPLFICALLAIIFFLKINSNQSQNSNKFDKLNNFFRVMKLIDDKYVEDPDMSDLAEGAILGMLNKLRELVKDNIDPNALIAGDTRTIVFQIPSSDLFSPGSANMMQEAGPLILETIAEEMQDGVKQVIIDGHTDNVPTSTAQFPSNWELSAARASSVARFIIKDMRFEPKFVVVSGYGEHRPMKPNSTDDNRASNRRVEIKIVKDKDVAAALKAKKKSENLAAANKAAGFE